MSFFGFKQKKDRFGVIIDIGSGSVLTAIVHSNSDEEHPQIVWSHREHAPLRNIDSLEQSSKAVMTALVNASMLLDGEGRKVLYDYNNTAKLTELQCSIAAPWSYTVTKSINYKQDSSFVITEELIDELTKTIQDKIVDDLKENEAMYDLGLRIIARSNMEMLSSGYRVKHPEGERAEALVISQASAIAQQYLTEAIDEIHGKLFPLTSMKKLSFILMLFSVSQKLLPETYDICLIDITYEATEIGIVRDGVLTYCTHTPFGYFSIAREISSITGVPLHEAFGYLHSDTPFKFMKGLNPDKKEEVDEMFESYIERIVKLFHETGDTLSIPRKLALHADLKSEPIFLALIEKAAKRTIKTEANITPISKEIIKQTYKATTKATSQKIPSDTALLLSAQFFHMKQERQSFEYF